MMHFSHYYKKNQESVHNVEGHHLIYQFNEAMKNKDIFLMPIYF